MAALWVLPHASGLSYLQNGFDPHPNHDLSLKTLHIMTKYVPIFGTILSTFGTQKQKQLSIMAEEKIFANGFSFKRRDNAPDFVVGKLSIKVEDAIDFLNSNIKNGWVNLSINKSKGGSYYLELDTFTPKSAEETTAPAKPTPQPTRNADLVDDDLPF